MLSEVLKAFIYLESRHFATHGQHLPRSLDVGIDGLLDLFVEAHRGRRVEHDRHVIQDQLEIRRRQAELRLSDVSRDGDHFVHGVRLLPLDGVEDLATESETER